MQKYISEMYIYVLSPIISKFKNEEKLNIPEHMHPPYDSSFEL